MTFGFQLAVRTAPNERIFEIDDAPPELVLPEPVGAVSLHVAERGSRQELMLRQVGLASADRAASVGRHLKDQIRFASALGLLGLDVGNDEATSAVGPGFFEEHPEFLACQVLPDVHGLVVFEETGQELRRPRVDVGQVVTRDSERLTRLLIATSSVPPLSPRVATACDILATADYHPRLEYRLIAMVLSAEVLAEPPPRTGEAALVVDRLLNIVRVEMATASGDDARSLRALLQAVQNLKREGISSTCRQLARLAQPETPDDAEATIRTAMAARGAFLHAASVEIDADQLTALRELVRGMISTRVAIERFISAYGAPRGS